jgi:phenylpyruvate tautomerase
VTVVPDQLMVWGGNDKPCGTALLMSIGCLGVEENKKHAAVLYPLLEKELGIPGDRFVEIISCLIFLDNLLNTNIFIFYFK